MHRAPAPSVRCEPIPMHVTHATSLQPRRFSYLSPSAFLLPTFLPATVSAHTASPPRPTRTPGGSRPSSRHALTAPRLTSARAPQSWECTTNSYSSINPSSACASGNMVQRLINRFGFIAQAHLDLAQKLTEGGERFDRVILDKKNRFTPPVSSPLPGSFFNCCTAFPVSGSRPGGSGCGSPRTNKERSVS